MKQKQIKSIHGLIDAGNKALAGVTAVGAAAGLPTGTDALVTQELTDLITAHGLAEQGRLDMATSVVALKDNGRVAHRFATEARDALKPTLGFSHNALWTAA